jgi:hypothetical protein
MAHTFVIRTVAATCGALALVGLTTVANASVLFHNTTDQTLHFSMTCNGAGYDPWTIAPHSTGSIACTNDSPLAQVEIRTDRDDGSVTVVRAAVFNGDAYALGYDREGDVNIAPLG